MPEIRPFGMERKNASDEATAIYSLAYAYSLIEKEISEYLRPFNITPAKFNALMVIKHKGKDKGLSQVEVGRSLVVTASNITRLMDKLVEEGFIERLSQRGDRRVNIVKITKKGAAMLDKIWPGYCGKIKSMGNNLDKNRIKQVSEFLWEWINILRR